MIDRDIRDYVRLVGSVSLSQQKKDRIAEYLIKMSAVNREITSKHVAAASAVAVLVISSVLIARGMRQDINVM
ncbi:MAG: hypothetical protein IJB45_02425 [Clostridia bacterium]|nr:hypothetical protein [Clostridia bacterium]